MGRSNRIRMTSLLRTSTAPRAGEISSTCGGVPQPLSSAEAAVTRSTRQAALRGIAVLSRVGVESRAQVAGERLQPGGVHEEDRDRWDLVDRALDAGARSLGR